MADETEKERLRREIKFLTDLISKANQKNAHLANHNPTAQPTSPRRHSHQHIKHLEQSRDVDKAHQYIKHLEQSRDVDKAHQHNLPLEQSKDVDKVYQHNLHLEQSKDVDKAHQHIKHLEQSRDVDKAHQHNLPLEQSKDVDKVYQLTTLPTCLSHRTQEPQERQSLPFACSQSQPNGQKEGNIVQNTNVSSGFESKCQSTMNIVFTKTEGNVQEANCARASSCPISLCVGQSLSLSSIPSTSTRMCSPLHKNQHTVPKTDQQGKQVAAKKRTLFSQTKHSSSVVSNLVSRHSSSQQQLISKTALVTAARETMQEKIENLKSSLAKLEVAKKRKLRKKSHSCVGPLINCQTDKTQLKTDNEVVNLNQDQESSAKKLKRTETDYLQKSQYQISLTKSDISSPNCLQMQFLNKSVMKKSYSVDSALSHGWKDKSSPLKSSVKANLEKELKATEEKLSDMRKKIGVMLRESPQKGMKCKGALANRQLQKTDLGTSPFKEAIHDGPSKEKGLALNHSATSESILTSTEKLRPFPNRKSLKWTPEKSVLQREQESEMEMKRARILRLLLKATMQSRIALAQCNHFATKANHLGHSHTRERRNYVRSKKSLYSLVRNRSSGSSSQSKESAATVLTPKKVHDFHSKSFRSRYKLQRPHSPAKASSSDHNLSRITIKSRYKMIKTVSKDILKSPLYSQGSFINQTASQRAARVIKSKYKIRRVPSQLPSFNSFVAQKQNNCLSTPKGVGGILYNAQPYLWKTRARKHSRSVYSSTGINRTSVPSFHTTTVPGWLRNSFMNKPKQRENNTINFYGGSWNRRQASYSPSNWWMAQQQSRMNVLQQCLWQHRTRRTLAWKLQQGGCMNYQYFPYQPWPLQTYRMKKTEQQRRLLLKRLHRMRKDNASRKFPNRQDNGLTKGSSQNVTQEHLVMINGILYKSSSRRLTRASVRPDKSNTTAASAAASASSSQTKQNRFIVFNLKQRRMHSVTVRGVSFKVDGRGTKLQRINCSKKQDGLSLTPVSRVDVGGVTYVQTKDGVLEKISDSQTRYVVNRVKQRSIALAAAKFKKKKIQNATKNCLFFTRFGKCSRGDKCPYLHDPEKIAVCTRFLRGTCKVENCPFSHKLSKEKMPVCAFFLRGVCTREDCPYLHVKVSQGADVCSDFVSGFCPLAEKCQKVHTLTCPHFAKTGLCPDGNKCRMLHRKRKLSVKHRVKSLGGPAHIGRCTKLSSDDGKGPAGTGKLPEDIGTPVSKFPQLGTVNSPGDFPHSDNIPVLKSILPDTENSPISYSTNSQERSDLDERNEGLEELLPHKPTKLPAFISLASYSLEDSPSQTAHHVKSQGTSKSGRGWS